MSSVAKWSTFYSWRSNHAARKGANGTGGWSETQRSGATSTVMPRVSHQESCAFLRDGEFVEQLHGGMPSARSLSQ